MAKKLPPPLLQIASPNSTLITPISNATSVALVCWLVRSS